MILYIIIIMIIIVAVAVELRVIIIVIITIIRTVKHKDDGDANCGWCTWNGPQRLLT